MMPANRSVCLFAILAGLAFGCAAPGEDVGSSEAAATSAQTILEANLHDEPNAPINASCDRITHLTLSKGSDGVLTVKLEDKLSPTSRCEIFVVPNARSFTVSESASCGSKVYKGGSADANVTVQDNRTRLCEDVRPSTIEVSETAAGVTNKMFGEPLAAKAFCPAALCGPNTECSEVERRCKPLATKSFCAAALCGPNTECNEVERRCKPLAAKTD